MAKITKEQKIIVSVLSVILIGIICYIEKDNIIKLFHFFKDRDELKTYVESFGYLSWLVFFLFQVLQVVVFFIPGEIIQATGGYIFGTFWGTVISFLGIGLGSYILFKLGERLGKNFVRKVISEKTHEKFEKLISGKNENLIVFILYLLPGFPKDSLALVCGITEMNAFDYMKWSMIGRIPALALCSYFGANLDSNGKYKALAAIIIAIVFCGIVYLFKKRIIEKLNKFNK